MAVPALKFEPEGPLEDRVARLEVNVEHIQKDVSEIKVDIRRLGDKIAAVDEKLTGKIAAVDEKLTGKIAAVDEKLNGRIDAVEKTLTDKINAVDEKLTGKIDSLKDVVMALALNVEKGFGELRTARAFERVWYLLMSAALLGIMARAFKWI